MSDLNDLVVRLEIGAMIECRDPLYGGKLEPIEYWWHHALCCHFRVPTGLPESSYPYWHEEIWLWAEWILEEREAEATAA